MSDSVYLVQQWQSDPFNDGNVLPCTVGVFDDENKAVDVCVTDEHFIFPLRLNEMHNGKPKAHPQAWYPLAKWKTELAQKDAARVLTD